MGMLTTLAMLILAAVAVAAFGVHFFGRASRREPAPKAVHDHIPLATRPVTDVGIAGTARVPFEPATSSGPASDGENDALEPLQCSAPIAATIPLPFDTIESPPVLAGEADEPPPQILSDIRSSGDVSFDTAREQIPLATEPSLGTPAGLGSKDEHRELSAPAEEIVVAGPVETSPNAGTDHCAVGANADQPTPQTLTVGAALDQSLPAIDSSSFQTNIEQPSPAAQSPEIPSAAESFDEPALPDEISPPIATSASDTSQPEISPPQDARPAADVHPRRQQAVHHDRRGRKRHQPKASPQQPAVEPLQTSSAKPLADVRLRLELHPIRETVQLSLVLLKPEGYPDTCTIDLNGGTQLNSYDENRFDDIDLIWLPDTLSNEFRFSAPGGFTWIRSARRIHIFASSATEPGFISVPAAVRGSEHAIVCRSEDADSVREVAEAAGSPELETLDHWNGVLAGWCVLTGYTPHHAAEDSAAGDFSSLDPRYNLEIRFAGGLQLRSNAFAEGHAPRIELPDLPDRVSVTIDGKAASADVTGAWQAEGWDTRGFHLIDLAPGPSLSYEIVADPANREGWPRWQPEAAPPSRKEAWAQTSICGASILGIGGETVLARETKSTLIALGSRGHATPFQRRSDANVSIALTSDPPAFLLAASGTRRHQGEVIWLGLEPAAAGSTGSRTSLLAWAGIVRSAASRRLPFQSNGSSDAKAAWQRTARRARDVVRRTV
jgi:hypothetical protein